MGRVVIACYVPKPGRETDLHELSRSHVARLRAEGLATGREPFIAVAADGSIIGSPGMNVGEVRGCWR